MRFVWAVLAFLLAAVLIGAGIAQRTVFQAPDVATVDVSSDSTAPFTLIDGAVLTSSPGAQTLTAAGQGTVFVAYGRTDDVKAWLADQTYSEVTLSDAGLADVQTVAPAETPAPTDAATEPPADATAPADAAAATGRSPVGSDLWLEEFQQDGELSVPLQLPDSMSVLVASDGTAPAPAELSLSWPSIHSTPWAGPLILAGAVMLLVGIVLYVLGLRHVRGARGPRRKGLPVAQTQPIDLAVEQADKGVIAATPSRRAIRSGGGATAAGRRSLVAVPAVGLAAVLFAGCSAEAWPRFDSTSTASPTPEVIVPDGQEPAVVTEAQADRIIARVADTVAAADEAKDADLAATRLGGAALTERQTNYTLRNAIADQPALAAVPSATPSILLPQASDQWPRTVMAVVEDVSTKASSIMLLQQDDPWADYKLVYVGSLEANAAMPDVAAKYVGAVTVPPDSSFLLLAPDQLAAAYADVLDKGDESTFAGLFEAEGDDFRPSVASDRQKRADEFARTGAETGTLVFRAAAGSQDPIALATIASGAIVAVSVNETDEVTPLNSNAEIKLDGETPNPVVQALTGVKASATGFTTTYGDQLFFYVPAKNSTEKIQLLGYSSNVTDAKVNP